MKQLQQAQIEQIRRLTAYQDNFDAIITFGYGPVQAGATLNSYKLNLYGRINAIATGMIYQSYHPNQIIPTGGKTGGLDKPSEAELMARLIQSKFDIPQSVFLLEEEAMETIFNLVYVANIIDQSPQLYQNLLFVALGCHLPRIQEICSLVRLNGSFIATEDVVKIRSERHKHLLLKFLQPGNVSYAKLLADQERGMRGLIEIPEYWVPPMGSLKNSHRLINILKSSNLKSFIETHQIDLISESIDNLHSQISLIPRQFPS